MPLPQARRIESTGGELVTFDDSSFEYRRQVWIALESERQACGYKPGWSFHRFEERFGVAPVVAEGELIDVPRATLQQKRAFFEHLAHVGQERGFKPGWARWRFRHAFGHWPKGFVSEVREKQLRDRLTPVEESVA